ncbi:MarR family transcriptional regulator [Candidatus Bathyarchaeota archaeon]|nr:MarR family transcriptional regulator [Candidatus Bathyarchaeota archaeon]
MNTDFPKRYSSFSLSDDFQLLCMLSNIGVITPAKSLTIEELSERTRLEISVIQKLLSKLVQEGYVEVSTIEFTEKYYLTLNGIRKVLSTYS